MEYSRAPNSSRMMVELITASDTVKHVNRSSVASGLDSWEVMSGIPSGP